MKKTILSLFGAVALMLTQFTVQAQVCNPTDGLLITCGSFGPGGVDPSAILQIDAENKGVLIPSMTEVQKLAILNPATSLLVFQTDGISGFYFYNGTAWEKLGGQDNDWVISGTDLYSGLSGNVGIGTNTPVEKLDIEGTLRLDNTLGEGVIYGFDENHGITFREAGQDRTNYYEYGGTLAAGLGHNFYSGGNKSSQVLRMQIADDGIYMADNVGIGTSSPSANLDVMGTFKLVDGTQAAGKVLTSDVNGNASWATSTSTDNQDLALAGNNLTLTNDATPVDLSAYLDNTDAQTLSLATNTLSISGGNNVNLSSYLDNTDAQDLALAGNNLTLTNDATPVDLSAYMDNTDAQTLTLSGTNLSIVNGNTVSLAGLGGGWGVSGNAGTVSGTNFIGTTDAQNLDIRTNNVLRHRFTQKGQIEFLSTGGSVMLGQGAGANFNLIGIRNVFIGFNSGTANTDGTDNIFLGHESGVSNTTGSNSIAIGYRASASATSSMSNVAVGTHSLTSNVIGASNVAIGRQALFLSTADNNTALGHQALYGNTLGAGNIGLGLGAGSNNTTGNNNTFIGRESNSNGGNLTNATSLGYQANVNASNKIRMGNTSITVAEVQVAWTVTSDKNAKKDIAYDVAGLDFINQLQPATYKYITHDETAPRYTGLLAQDVEATLQGMGIESSIVTKPNEDGTGSWGIRYAELTMPLINAVQELSKENEQLKNQVNQLQAKVNEVDQLKTELSQIKALLSQQASK